MRRLVLISMVGLVAVPICSSSASLLFGTEDLPELPDGTGDVEYDRLYTGPRDQGYGDLTAAWFAYENGTDELLLTIRTANGEALQNAPRDWEVRCAVFGNLTTEGEVVRDVIFDWRKASGGDSIEHSVLLGPEQRNAVNPERAYRTLEHRFESELREPGYFRFWLPRATFVQLGDEFTQPRGQCSERFNHPFGTLIQNMDHAASEAVYSFKELRPTRSAQGEPIDPIEGLPTETLQETAESSRGSKTSGPGALLVVLSVAMGLSLRRRLR